MTTRPHRPRISRGYQRATLAFIGASLVVVAIVVVTTMASATVTVRVAERTVEQTASVSVATTPSPTGDNELEGTLVAVEATGTVTEDSPATGNLVDDYAHGPVTIVNRWTQTQPLAAKTRLKAASNGKIYRTAQRVDVPRGSQVEVEVVADDPGAAGEIGPDRFTIVALWPGLQDQIFGESRARLTGGTRSSTTLGQPTIDAALTRLDQQLAADAATKAQTPPAGMMFTAAPSCRTTSSNATAKAGDPVTGVTVSGTARCLLAAVKQSQLEQLTTSLLQGSADPTEGSVGQPQLSWKLLQLNERASTAQLELTVSQALRLRPDAPALARQRFLGKSAAAIAELLHPVRGVADVRVQIKPAWLRRTPGRADRIEVIVLPSNP